jgi:hypothetical protein
MQTQSLRGVDRQHSGAGSQAFTPEPAASSLALGECLGRYTLRAHLGAGGMGEVYAAHDPELDRVVALKVLRTCDGDATPTAIARFQREVLAMARLNHPNVVSVFDAGRVGDRVFVAMELVEGPTLASWLAERPRHFFRPDGPMPEEVELRLTIPPELGPEAEVLAELRERVQTVEAEHEAERQRTGRRVLGRRAVLQQSWRAYPSSVEPRRNLRPQVASRSKWSRIDVLLRNRAFIEDYIRARDAWRVGSEVAFPPGTYWLRRFANVSVAAT